MPEDMNDKTSIAGDETTTATSESTSKESGELLDSAASVEGMHDQVKSLIYRDSGPLKYHQELVVDLTMFAGVLFVALIIYFIVHKIVFGMVRSVAAKSKNKWDDELLKSRVLRFISLLVPAMLVRLVAPSAFRTEPYSGIISMVTEVFIIVMVLAVLNSLLNIASRIYRRYEVSRKFPVKSFIQVLKIILLICCVIFIISSVIGKSPILIFSGLGAMTAILMLIFKDSILGLVAGIQLSANQMVARGDWIEMPKFGANGEVLEVALTTVKVRNFDKTITTIPTYALISDSFKNWRGMASSGVRRIMRSINIDIHSVGFLSKEEVEEMRKVKVLTNYINDKEKELDEWNQENAMPSSSFINERCLTNIGTFRAYITEYVKAHPKISESETLLIRQLEPGVTGVPIQLYIFCTDNRWVHYENIQGDIFDHLLAVLPKFGLRVYQNPSGDLNSLIASQLSD